MTKECFNQIAALSPDKLNTGRLHCCLDCCGFLDLGQLQLGQVPLKSAKKAQN